MAGVRDHYASAGSSRNRCRRGARLRSRHGRVRRHRRGRRNDSAQNHDDFVVDLSTTSNSVTIAAALPLLSCLDRDRLRYRSCAVRSFRSETSTMSLRLQKFDCRWPVSRWSGSRPRSTDRWNIRSVRRRENVPARSDCRPSATDHGFNRNREANGF